MPEAFFLIVIDESEGKLRALALIVPQEVPTADSPEHYLTSIDDIQQHTGLNFLCELDDAAEKQVEAQRATRV